MMKRILSLAFILGSVLLCESCKNGSGGRKVPLEDFFSNPEKTAFMLSPNGESVAYMQPYKNRLNIYVRELLTNQVTQITADTQDNIKHCWWADNHTILYIKDNNGDEFYHLYRVYKDGTNSIDLTPFENTKVLVRDTQPDSIVILGLNRRDPKLFDAFRLNIHTGVMKEVMRNPGNVVGWYPDDKNRIRLAVSSSGLNETLLYRSNEKEPFQKVLTTNFTDGEYVSPEGFVEGKPHVIYAISNLNRDKRALVTFDLSTGKEVEVIYQNDSVDIGEVKISDKDNRLLYLTYQTWKTEFHFFDHPAKQLYQHLMDKLPNVELSFASVDVNESKFIIRTYDDRSPGSYYLFESDLDRLSKLSDVSPQINPDEMSPMEHISYQSRDGLTIHGYLTLPKAKLKTNLPVVIVPHDGPWKRNKWGFDPEVQFLANRGYAVLQMNYRGSKGYGNKFMKASYQQWGNKVQNDINDGVQWLINQGIADSSRLAIYGYGFGGYCALNAVVQHPNLYQCAVSYSGLTNLFTYLKDIPPYYKPFQQMFYEIVGNPEKDAEMLRKVSPIFHAEDIHVPLLIAQGAQDPRVNADETSRFVDKLRNAGVDVNYMLKENEGHLFRKEENRLDFYAELEKFLAQNLKK